MLSTDRQEVSANWRSRGFSFDVWEDAPRQRWENFVHDQDELVMLLEGELELEIGGEVYHPKPGQEYFIPAGTRHSVRNLGASSARWAYGYRQG